MRTQVGIVGMCSWDHLIISDRYPVPGSFAVVERQIEQPGGTAANTCVALAKLGHPPLFSTCVGNDAQGQAIIQAIADAGCTVEHIVVKDEPTDYGWIVLAPTDQGMDRLIYWVQGARPKMGDKLPIEELLEHNWILLDIDNSELRSFLLSLPAHRSPRTKLLGTINFLTDLDPDEGMQQALQHDGLFGNRQQLMMLTRTESVGDAVAAMQAAMIGSACQVLYISCGADGAMAIRKDRVTEVPAPVVDAVDTTGAGDAFVGGCLWGILDRLDDRETLLRGTITGSLSCRDFGAQSALPDRHEVERMLTTMS